MDEKTMDIIEETETNESGNIKIAQDVVATIAGMATADVEGVAGMSGGISDGIAQILGKKQLTRGVKVEIADNSVKIDLFIIVNYGQSIAKVATAVQKSVKDNVENMTGMQVTAVNVNVQGISFPQQETAASEPEVEVVSE